MSTLSGVTSKGEKGKPKYQCLDINSIYNKHSKGESSEQHQTKSTAPRKHGMQSLGKIPPSRRAPVNLPSLKSEHSGNDPTVSLVPTGGTGWGSKPSDAPPITSTSPVSTSGQTQGTNAPAVVGTAPVPQTNITPTPPQPPKPVASVGSDKTWSSVMVGAVEGGSGGVNLVGGSGPSFLAHQSPQFQAEFPSLPGEDGAPGPPPRAGEGGYGPGPSLRPQTEGSWAQGGGYQAPPTTQDTQPRPLNQPPTANIVPQYKGVIPQFMLNSKGGGSNNSIAGGFPGMFPSNFQNPPPIRTTNKFHNNAENRFIGGGSRPPPLADPEDIIPRPIIKEEDLNRMDEISREAGWATQDDIDYNQKLAFSDDESTGNDDDKDKDKGRSSLAIHNKEEKKDIENEKENRDSKISITERQMEKGNQPWQGRNSANIPTPDFRNPLSRLSHTSAREMDIDDEWKEKRRQQSEQVAAVAEKAKQRKEEEEKRFEETRSRTESEKKKKDENIENEWDKEEKKDPVENFRQMTQLEPRNYPRSEPQQSYPRYQNALPPRFQKQHNIRQQQQQQSGGTDNRWGNTQHFTSNKQRTRGDSDEIKEKEDERDKRERNTPEPSDRFRSGGNRNDRGYDNRKSGYYDNHDYGRSYHRDYDQERDRNKDTESRMRDRENEVEWDNRKVGGGSAWESNKTFEDKNIGRRDNKKSNDNYSKPHSALFDDRDNDWRDRPDNRDRPVRPDSRDSRTSRDSRASREDTRTIPETVANDYSWAEADYEKEIHEEKPRRKDNYKDDRREAQNSRREGHVPGPITKEKMEAYEHKHKLAQPEKKEVLGSTSLENKCNEEDGVKKSDSVSNNSNLSWADSADDSSGQQQQATAPHGKTPSESQPSHPVSSPSDDINDKTHAKEESTTSEKKKETTVNSTNTAPNKDKNVGVGRGGGRSGRGGSRQQSHYSTNYVYYRGSSSYSNIKDANRRGSSKSRKQWVAASDSEASGDEISASTESGKEDKKNERKQTSRSPKSGERKKDDHRDTKKNESIGSSGGRKSHQQQQQLPQHNSSQQQLQSHQGQQSQGQTTLMYQNQQQGGGYDSGGGGRKEGFPPRGEPSRRGRGAYRTPGGRVPHSGAHYGPPGSKPAFPTPPPTSKDEEAADSSSEEKKKPAITGRKDQRKGDSDSSRSSKTKSGKIKRDHEEWETTSEGSDSEAKGKLQRSNKKLSQRITNDKRGPFSSIQINGRPSRHEEGKIDESILNKEDDQGLPMSNHTDIYHTNNGFQEVRSKKTGKDNRPLSKEELKRNRGKEGKGKGPQGGNAKGSQGKAFLREWCSNKPPRLQRAAFLHQQQQQQSQLEVSDMNKLNQSIAMFPIRTDIGCPAPAPPPSVNAWDKPITAALRTSPPPSNLQHIAPTIASSQEKNVIELNDHAPSGTNSQTSSPSAEKALSKMGREAAEKALLDGATPPVQTIIFENTNFKVAPNEMAMKNKYPLKGQRIDKGRVERKLDEELEDGTHMGLGFKPGSEIKSGENKPQEPIQMPMSFSKSEDNADMKLDFEFDSDLSQLTDDKSNIPRSIHQVLGQNSAADLNQKIASVKKVWETPGSMMEHQHHDEVVSTSSSFTPNFGSAVDTSLDHSSAHQVDDTSFATPDVYAHQNPTNRTNFFIIAPQLQGNAAGYASGAANIIKQDPSNASSNVCKVKPQPQAVISSAIGTHSGGPSLSSPPPPFTQQGHFNYQTQYSNIPAIPSPPAVLINSPAGGQQVPPSHQGELYHSFPMGGPTVIGSQQARSGFSQYPYGLGQGLGGTSAFSQQSLYHLPQPAAPNPPPDVFQSLSQYRIQPSYGQSQQLSNSPSTVLITSSSNSLMSASVKSSPQPPIGAIGTKAGYQSSAHPSQVQLGYIQYDATPMLPQSFLQNSQLVQRHGGNNVVPAIQPPTSYYSGSAGGQTGLFQPGSSILAGGGSQPAALHNAATAFGIQGFSAQSATAPAQPNSNNPVGVPSYSSQIGHFRAQAPAAAYLKAAGGNPVTGQHVSDPAKSPSTSQDVMSSVFSSGGGGQIPSPKSRNTGNSGAGGKPTQQPSQQPSPTQGHHKFASYQAQQNLVMQGNVSNSNQQQQGGRGVGPVPQGVRTGNNNGNSLGNNSGMARYPSPIQRPINYSGMQTQRHRAPQQSRPSQQQHLQKISSQYYQQQGNTVKIDVEGKSEGDKLQEQTNSGNTKQEKKEETASNTEQ